jgi:arginyl-tRNA synthetase
LQDTASAFHSFYNKNRVITDDAGLSLARLYLCAAVKNVIANGLDLLGITSPEKM